VVGRDSATAFLSLKWGSSGTQNSRMAKGTLLVSTAGGGTGVVITAGSWKKLDWLRELQTAEITTLSHDRNIHRTQEGARTHTSAARCQQREAEGGSSGQFRRSSSPALSNYCNGHVSVLRVPVFT
jgi:hypothetical protein